MTIAAVECSNGALARITTNRDVFWPWGYIFLVLITHVHCQSNNVLLVHDVYYGTYAAIHVIPQRAAD